MHLLHLLSFYGRRSFDIHGGFGGMLSDVRCDDVMMR